MSVTRKTSVEIDPSLLGQVKEVLATHTIRDTIDAAFREVIRQHAQREEIEALATSRGSDVADEDLMARAWR